MLYAPQFRCLVLGTRFAKKDENMVYAQCYQINLEKFERSCGELDISIARRERTQKEVTCHFRPELKNGQVCLSLSRLRTFLFPRLKKRGKGKRDKCMEWCILSLPPSPLYTVSFYLPCFPGDFSFEAATSVGAPLTLVQVQERPTEKAAKRERERER